MLYEGSYVCVCLYTVKHYVLNQFLQSTYGSECTHMHSLNILLCTACVGGCVFLFEEVCVCVCMSSRDFLTSLSHSSVYPAVTFSSGFLDVTERCENS